MVGPRLVGSLGKDGEQGPQGETGPQGPQGPQGEPGESAKEIDRIIKYYVKHNNSDSAPPANEASYSNNSWFVYGYANGEYTYWQTTIPDLDTTNKYIWSLDLITYKNNTNDYLITNIKRDYGAEGLLIAQDFDISGLENYFTRTDGLIQFAQGSDGISLTGNNSIFKVTSNAMGFFGGTGSDATPLCYYENGNMVLRGTVYANEGVIGGVGKNLTNAWRIKGYSKVGEIETPAAIYSGDRNSLNSPLKGVYIGTDGISFSGANNSTKPNLLFSYIEEDSTTRGSLSVDVLTVSNLILENKLGGGDIEGLTKESFGIFSGDAIPSSTTPVNSKNGDIYVKYSSEIATQQENTTTSEVSVTVSNGGVAFPPIQPYFTETRYHGTYANWNGWKDSTSHNNNTIYDYIKIGRNNSGRTLGAFRGTFTTSMSGSSNTGVTSATSFNLSITGSYKPFNSYDTENYTSSSGTLKALVFDSSTATVPVASGVFNLNYYGNTSRVTLTASMTGQIISGKTYYITIQGSTGNLFYITPGTIEISSGIKTIAVKKEPFTPELYIKSANSWVPVASSMWVVSGTRSAEDTGQTTPDCGPETYSNAISWTTISGERAWNIHYSSNLANGNPGLAQYEKLLSDNGGKTGAVIIPSNGIYSINFSFYLSQPNTSYRRFCAAILRNGFGGRYKLNANGVITREDINIDCAVSWTGPLNKNDRIYFGTYTDGNLTSDLKEGTGSAFNYSIVRLGTLL